jgi:hypothetical protein
MATSKWEENDVPNQRQAYKTTSQSPNLLATRLDRAGWPTPQASFISFDLLNQPAIG